MSNRSPVPLRRLATTMAGILMALSLVAGSAAAQANTIPVGPGAKRLSVEIPDAMAAAARDNRNAVLLRLENIALPEGVSPVISVFAGLSTGTSSALTDDPRFLGTISNVLRGETGHRRVMPGGVVDVTRALRSLPAGIRALDITLVPVQTEASANPVSVARASFMLRP